MIALYIGRFQPFHKGHLDALKQIVANRKVTKIIIGVGSAQYSDRRDNPYSFAERKSMIERAIAEMTGEYAVVAIPDIHDDERWVAHVQSMVGPFDVVYTGNEHTKKLFADQGLAVEQLRVRIPISGTRIRDEADRLYAQLQKVKRTYKHCLDIAPLTLEINALKKEHHAIILAHSYQAPEIMYGVADFLGDSYGLAKIATEHAAKTIIFCSVHFMGETAKILNPEKRVFVPAVAGCSLAESITAEDVRTLKKKHPGLPVVCYINTDASVKAESDVCCTSANALRIIESLDAEEVIFIPDILMGQNLQEQTSKRLILWHGNCIVHETFDEEALAAVRSRFPDTKILVHYECTTPVAHKADLVGSTNDILQYVKTSDAKHFMLVTECGITDRVKTEYKNKQIVGTCQLCPYMKSINLASVLAVLKNPQPEQEIKIPQNILQKAKHALDTMMSL